MDVDEKLWGLTDLTGYPIEEGMYLGTEDIYFVYVYEDERPSFFADDESFADTAYIQLSFFSPKNHEYKRDKKLIRNYLEKNGFQVTSIQSWIDKKAITGTEDVRHTTFSINITQQRMQEE